MGYISDQTKEGTNLSADDWRKLVSQLSAARLVPQTWTNCQQYGISAYTLLGTINDSRGLRGTYRGRAVLHFFGFQTTNLFFKQQGILRQARFSRPFLVDCAFFSDFWAFAKYILMGGEEKLID